MRPGLLKRWATSVVDPRRALGVFGVARYVRDYMRYHRLQPLRLNDTYPCLHDWSLTTPFDPHYVYQGYWLAERLAAYRPARHCDVGSSVLTMSTIAGFVKTTFIDYRPLVVQTEQLRSLAGDIVHLPLRDASVESLSCLHVIEHVGLGRYGDPLDAAGTERAARELVRVVAKGGRLFLAVPVGRERVEFNAHRVLEPQTILRMFEPLQCMSFGLVDDRGRYLPNARLEVAAHQMYGCGLFEFVKV